MISRILKALTSWKGAAGKESLGPLPTSPETEDHASGKFPLFGTYALKDGHQIASDLKRNQIPFEVEMQSGIDEVSVQFGSGGDCATMSIYVAEENWEVVNIIIEERFHA